jgi:hypothetical protein
VSHVVAVELEMPDGLARFRMPSGVDARRSELLDRQDREESLSVAKRQEDEGLVNLAETLSLLRLRAQRAGQKALWRAPRVSVPAGSGSR